MGQLERVQFGPQQREVLRLAVAGSADKEIARQLGMKPETVRTHISRLCVKLGAANRCQLGAIASRAGMLPEVEVDPEAIARAPEAPRLQGSPGPIAHR